MAFNPSSTIYLCNVPIDSTYQNEIYFSSRTAQQNYFASKVVKTFSDYLTVRATRPDGSLVSSVKVAANIDYLRGLPCNYMYYQNENHGTRIFYAFITQFIYINEGTTEIVFETDVYQTWMLDCELKPSYVVREHSESDKIGENIVPEKFNFQDYVYQVAHQDGTLDSYGYLIGSTENDLNDPNFWEQIFGGSSKPVMNMRMYSGVLQGLYFYYFPDVHEVAGSGQRMDSFLNEVVEKNGECIVFIATIPHFSVSGNVVGANDNDRSKGMGWVYSSTKPAEKDIVIKDATVHGSFEGFSPVNNKLFTSPFYKLIVTNHNGEQGEYCIEDFADSDNITFTMYGDVSANPTVTLIPRNYKGITKNYDAGISISGFPQVSLNTDTFKLWLAKNQYGVGLDALASVGQIVAGVAAVAAAPATGGVSLGVGGFLGASGVVSGVQGVLSNINGVYQASKEPNRSTTGGGKTNLLTGMKLNKFEYFIQTIKREHAQTVDSFFTMYGYQTNKVKVPNVSSRPRFNYVQTVDVNIVGGIPSDDMAKLKNIFNKGVTLWKSNTAVGDYSVDNRPQ